MVLLAVVLAAIAVVMAIGLVSSEGMRFDGIAQMSPWQPVHLKQRGGGELVIALGDLTPVAIDGAVEAKVMDDEGYGIRTLEHLRLDRSLGAGVQAGRRIDDLRARRCRPFRVRQRHAVRVVRPTVAGAAADGGRRRRGRRVRRDADAAHVRVRAAVAAARGGPVPVRRLRQRWAAAIASTAQGSGPAEWGNAIGGGVLGELQVTSRLALTLRAGANEAFFANSGTTSPAATFAAGIALY